MTEFSGSDYSNLVIQYCEKVMQTKCANFVLCFPDLSRESSRKSSSRTSRHFTTIRALSLEQRTIFSRTFAASTIIREILLAKTINFARLSTTVRLYTCRLHYEIDCSTGHVTYTKNIFVLFAIERRI